MVFDSDTLGEVELAGQVQIFEYHGALIMTLDMTMGLVVDRNMLVAACFWLFGGSLLAEKFITKKKRRREKETAEIEESLSLSTRHFCGHIR